MTRSYLNNILPVQRPSRYLSLKFIFPALILLIVALQACEEEPSIIGTEILPENDFVNISSTDTISVFSYTLSDDSIQSDDAQTSFLGAIYDPYFGITKAEIVTQLRLREDWPGKPFFVDSVKLKLALYNVSGNVNTVHTLRFWEIDEQIYLDSVYYSNKQVALADPAKYWDVTLPKLKIDTVNFVDVVVPADFANRLMRDTSMLFHDNSRPDFRAYFKGIKMSLISLGAPVFASVSLAPPSGGDYYNYFTVFYTESGGTPKRYYFIMDALSKNARINLYTHDFSAASPDKRIRYLNQPVEDTVSYVQGLSGAFTKVLLPGLAELKNDPSMNNIAVNRARLIVPVFSDNSLYKGSKMAAQLYIRYKTADGSKFFVPDYNPNNTFFDGKVDTTTNVVRFNIASYVQNYFEDKTNSLQPEVEIFITTGSIKNAILKTGESSTPARFEFTYTKF